jgi:transposase
MSQAYIGLDVHKTTISIAIAFFGNDEPVSYGKCSSDINRFLKTLRRLMKKHSFEKKDIKLCYEAGPCGFVLARHLLRLGFDTTVIAPSLIPRQSGDKFKTDKRDARKLARHFRSGNLTAVHIPDESDEVIRDLCRARTDAVDDCRRSRQRLLSFLLRNGHHYTGKSNWTEAHMRYLRELVLQDSSQKVILEEYLQTIDSNMQRVVDLEENMRTLQAGWTRSKFAEALQGFRGFQLVASMIITSELGDLTRFDHPRKLMSYLGLVPTEDSSGDRRRQGAITKCGNSHARWILVEIAGCYRYDPKISRALSYRQEGLSKAVKELSWRAQKRLNHRYVRLAMRRLHKNKIKVAIARELAAFIWELGQIIRKESSIPDSHRYAA